MTETSKHPNVRRRHGQEGPTEKMREYLEVIYYLSARREPVIGARLAEWMRVTPPTVTNIVQRMEEQGYIARDGRGEIRLTDEGFTLAEAMVKRHANTVYVFAVGMRDGTATATFTLPGLQGPAKVEVLDEGRWLDVHDGAFRDRLFDPSQVFTLGRRCWSCAWRDAFNGPVFSFHCC